YLLLGGLALLGLDDFQSIRWLGYVALVVCIVFLGVGIMRYIVLNRRLYKWHRVLFTDTIPEDNEKNTDDTASKYNVPSLLNLPVTFSNYERRFSALR
ncbi:MAG TPA: hypothetical protein DEG69_23575, partial [Flavobacteriaceae bacterium]|nr:hypothetical protein [Flavobacteriaceae bacterium]